MRNLKQDRFNTAPEDKVLITRKASYEQARLRWLEKHEAEMIKKKKLSLKKQESKIQQHLINRLEGLFVGMGYLDVSRGFGCGLEPGKLYRIDVTTSTMYSDRGRQDVYVDFGAFHFRIEVKTDTGRVSDYQEERYKADKIMAPGRSFILKGMAGVEKFIQDLPDHMAEQQRHFVVGGAQQVSEVRDLLDYLYSHEDRTE